MVGDVAGDGGQAASGRALEASGEPHWDLEQRNDTV